MANYEELFGLSANGVLIQRLTIAVAVACETIRTEGGDVPYHTERVAWARRALTNPDGMARQVLMCALAQNRALTVEQITGATDTALQTATDSAIALLL